jgi:nitrogen fixation/metabolism regulation signal transduction histidine kinase
VILAAPQLLDDVSVRQQQEDIALTLLAAAGAGLVAAIYLAGAVARGLARPVAALREAADAVGRGAPLPPFPPGSPVEFEPVITAFERMAADVRSSQAALEDARRRTAQVLANVATGVIAVDDRLAVTLANGRAAALVGAGLEHGAELGRAGGREWAVVWSAVADYVAGGAHGILDREFPVGARQVRVQIAPLGAEGGGCVVALDDATALTRAARVLAWGEMARQVAHEIKNPLTPIRLGIQHLQRARRSPEFDATLRDTSTRILAEIDRLDAIARAFSRFGSPATEGMPLEAVDLHAVAREVVQLYSLGGVPGAAHFELEGAAGPPVQARRDEVKEVLVNLLENARNAGARRVAVRISAEGREVAVRDDGRRIPAEALPRVFEPAFSTTSSGSGLGLAIAKRLVESWGGTITLASTHGSGTTVAITLVPPAPAGNAST